MIPVTHSWNECLIWMDKLYWRWACNHREVLQLEREYIVKIRKMGVTCPNFHQATWNHVVPQWYNNNGSKTPIKISLSFVIYLVTTAKKDILRNPPQERDITRSGMDGVYIPSKLCNSNCLQEPYSIICIIKLSTHVLHGKAKPVYALITSQNGFGKSLHNCIFIYGWTPRIFALGWNVCLSSISL